MMDVLPNVPAILLAVVLAWVYWPALAETVTRAAGKSARFGDPADDIADDLFEAWPNRHGS